MCYLTNPWIIRIVYLVLLALLLPGFYSCTPAETWLNPSLQGQFWTQSLPFNARLKPAHLYASQFGADINYTVIANPLTPVVAVCMPMDWADRVSHCKPTTLRVPLPKAFVIPATKPGNTPNNPLTIYNPQHHQLWRLNGSVRPQAGGPLYAYANNATHGGSGLSGGDISRSELYTGIHHAIGINIWGQRFLSPLAGGFVSPATQADSYYQTGYGGNNPLLKMGSRLAISPHVTSHRLGLETMAGQRVLHALQHYGAYVVDDSAWDCFYIQATPEAAPVLEAAKADMLKLFSVLSVVSS